jgi:hypothetical protein
VPKTRLSRWAGWLFVAGFVLLALLIVAYNTEALGGLFEQGTAGVWHWGWLRRSLLSGLSSPGR